MKERRIVCAAIRFDGFVVCGARHFDMVMHGVLEKLFSKDGPSDMAPKGEQGFIDNNGEFLDRKEAYKVALEANQLLSSAHIPFTLFSEDLY